MIMNATDDMQGSYSYLQRRQLHPSSEKLIKISHIIWQSSNQLKQTYLYVLQCTGTSFHTSWTFLTPALQHFQIRNFEETKSCKVT